MSLTEHYAAEVRSALTAAKWWREHRMPGTPDYRASQIERHVERACWFMTQMKTEEKNNVGRAR
jgi:hypothetical protein